MAEAEVVARSPRLAVRGARREGGEEVRGRPSRRDDESDEDEHDAKRAGAEKRVDAKEGMVEGAKTRCGGVGGVRAAWNGAILPIYSRRVPVVGQTTRENISRTNDRTRPDQIGPVAISVSDRPRTLRSTRSNILSKREKEFFAQRAASSSRRERCWQAPRERSALARATRARSDRRRVPQPHRARVVDSSFLERRSFRGTRVASPVLRWSSARTRTGGTDGGRCCARCSRPSGS